MTSEAAAAGGGGGEDAKRRFQVVVAADELGGVGEKRRFAVETFKRDETFQIFDVGRVGADDAKCGNNGKENLGIDSGEVSATTGEVKCGFICVWASVREIE